MHSIAAAKSSYSLATLGVAGSLLLLIAFAPHVGALDTGTPVGATVCQGGSAVTLTQPVSDSTVTEATVPLAGSVTQANQIEVYIDDVFDSVIPLTLGQSTFTGSAQIVQGTHTIKVVAIDICSGVNGTFSSIVTYEPPPDTVPSTGGETPTDVGGGDNDTVLTAGQELKDEGVGGQPLQVQLSIPFQQFLGWLNINTADTTEGQSLSIWRAVVIGSGLYLMVVGVATTAVQLIASVPAISALLPAPTNAGRVKYLSWGFRGLGLLLLLGGLFL